MQGLFGRLKDKLVRAVSAPAQEELGNLKDMLSSLQSTTKPFDADETKRRLELILENCNKWQVYIINESSTGLFFCENHNRKCIEAKCRANNEAAKRIAKRRLTVDQIDRTNRELEELTELSGSWCTRLTQNVQELRVRPTQ
mgnify:FL=1|jgi:hypothetical protein